MAELADALDLGSSKALNNRERETLNNGFK